MTRTIAVVTAGLTRPSSTRLLADQLAAAAVKRLDPVESDSVEVVTVEVVTVEVVTVEVVTIEVRDIAHDLVNNLLTGFPAPELKAALDAVAGADGVIAVTPTFNASYNGLFKMFFDVLGDAALVDKPVLIAATGGTVRHSLALEHALRPMFAHLRAVVAPTSVFAAPEDWAGADGGSAGGAGGSLRVRIDRAAAELADLIGSRKPAVAPDPFALTTTFDDLLAG
ncbi:FMN reductase [Luedemannella flava]|uniref:FMN reductase n=1 Tax=Luedemannella flava TaxID=349316 RepID=A0ABP4YIV5_9ACTN